MSARHEISTRATRHPSRSPAPLPTRSPALLGTLLGTPLLTLLALALGACGERTVTPALEPRESPAASSAARRPVDLEAGDAVDSATADGGALDLAGLGLEEVPTPDQARDAARTRITIENADEELVKLRAEIVGGP